MKRKKPTLPRKAATKDRSDDARHEFGRERISAAAVKLANGSVYTGLFHGDALSAAEAAHARNSRPYYDRLVGKSLDGYLTNWGRFVDAEEGFEIAVKCRQMTAKSHAQSVKDLWGEKTKTERWLSSLSFNEVRAF